jgi:exoribonuclease R
MIAGILIVEGNRTYGKIKNKYFYKCVLCNGDSILVSYAIKNIGLQKHFKNMYVLVHLTQVKHNNHIVGTLVDTIGDVDILSNFYKYNLHAKDLYSNGMSDFKKSAKVAWGYGIGNNHNKIITDLFWKCGVDRTQGYNVISIDPKGSKDIDDAFSVQSQSKIGDHSKNVQSKIGEDVISIYIANVPLCLEHLDLWKYLTDQVSTIYLPNGNLSMLPGILSNDFCSLLEHYPRTTLVCDITVQDGSEIVNVEFSTCVIGVENNYNYDEIDSKKITDSTYNKVQSLVSGLNQKYKFANTTTADPGGELDSHQVIEWLMVAMNYFAAKTLAEKQCGIFRGINTSEVREVIPEFEGIKSVQNLYRGLQTQGGKYSTTPQKHDFLGLDAYCHITSPIRRLPDLLNSLKLQHVLGLISFKDETLTIYDKWITQLEIVNDQMKKIKKVQIEARLLELCVNSPGIASKEFKGYICGGEFRGKRIVYTVYLPDIQLLGIWKTLADSTYKIGDSGRFKIYHFKNKTNFKQKVVLDLLNY